MDSMQAEALRRAQEMHSKALNQSLAPNRDAQRQSEKIHHSKNTQGEDITQNEVSTDSAASLSSPSPTLFEDKEKLLILVLILLIMEENSTDTSVILALLYLII